MPGIKSHVVPKGLVDRDGEDAMVEYLKSVIRGILAGKPERRRSGGADGSSWKGP